jgi:hypothetical protein
LVVDRLALPQQAQGFAKLLLWRLLHPHQQPAGATAIGPVPDVIVKLLSPAQVEIPDAEISAIGDPKRLSQCSQQLRFNVIEDTRHGSVSSVGPLDFKESPGARRFSRSVGLRISEGATHDIYYTSPHNSRFYQPFKVINGRLKSS